MYYENGTCHQTKNNQERVPELIHLCTADSTHVFNILFHRPAAMGKETTN